MKYIKSAVAKGLIISLLFTLLLPAGGLLLGLGIAGGVKAAWVTGIVCLVLGFYGCPVAWTAIYAPKKPLLRLVSAIENEHIYTVKELATHLSLPEATIRRQLGECLTKRYLRGYKRNGDEIILNTAASLADKEQTVRCPYCGAQFTYRQIQNPRCPYCGSFVTENK